MAFWKATEESPRVFEKDWLDALTRTPWWLVPLVYLPLISALVWYSIARTEVGWLATAGLFVAGLITWTMCEYWLHRTFFHWIPNGKLGERMHFFVHGIHHQWPKDKYRLVLPPAASIFLFVAFLGLWTLAFGPWGVALHAGFTFGYMAYDVIHYRIHHGRAGIKWLQQLKKHHAMHHYDADYQELRFGVSAMFWDRVFGTLEDEHTLAKKEARAQRRASRQKEAAAE